MHPLILAAIAGGHQGGVTPQLFPLSSSLTSSLTPSGGNRPQVLMQFGTDGVISEAIGDTGSALSPVSVGNWLSDLTGLDNTDWEVAVTIVSEDTGAPGSWTPVPGGSFQVLNFVRSFTWTKDVNDVGNANSVLSVTLRQVSNTSNSVTRSVLNYNSNIT